MSNGIRQIRIGINSKQMFFTLFSKIQNAKNYDTFTRYPTDAKGKTIQTATAVNKSQESLIFRHVQTYVRIRMWISTVFNVDRDPDLDRHQAGISTRNQCCGAGTGTEETATFCLSGTRTGMHYGSGSGSGSNMKCNKKVLKNQKWDANFLGNKLLLTLKRQDFVFGKLCQILSGSGTGTEAGTKLSKVGTGLVTAKNHYGSTTLPQNHQNRWTRTVL
jgi:hypothetical protein